MTNACGGGSSSVKPGINSSVYVDQAFIQSLLPPALAWLFPYLPFMQGLAIGDVPTFCGTDPPALVSLPTPAQFISFMTGGPYSDYVLVNDFLVRLTQQFLWSSLCQCGGGGAPTLPTPPSNPGNLPTVNPPQIPPPGGPPCLDLKSNLYTITAFNQFANMLPIGALETNGGDGNDFAQFPTGANTWVLNWSTGIADGSGAKYNITFALWDAAKTTFSGVQQVIGAVSGQTGQFVGATSALTPYFNVTLSGWTNAGPPTGVTAQVGCEMIVQCGGTPGAPQVPCCPPDPLLKGLLGQINNLVTLIQRQAVPFAYVSGTVHAGLTGTGSIAVQGLLGARIAVTTDSATLGAEGTSPAEIFGRGFITFATADGALHSARIEHPTQLLLPCDAGIYTLIYYDLNPLITISITELKREP